jgi:hypothetical protein
MLGFFLILAVVILFIYYLRQYREIQKEINSDYVSDEKRKTRILPVIGVVAVGLFTFYAQTLFSLSVYVLEDSQNLKEIREIYNDAVKDTANTKTEVKTMYLECVQSVSDLLRSSPDLGNRENLLEICSLLGLKAVNLYDAEGVMTVSTGDYSGLKFGTKETDDRYQFNQLKNGYPYVVLDPQKNKETGEMTQQFAVHLYDRSGSISGFMEIVCLTEQLVNALKGKRSQSAIYATLSNLWDKGLIEKVSGKIPEGYVSRTPNFFRFNPDQQWDYYVYRQVEKKRKAEMELVDRKRSISKQTKKNSLKSKDDFRERL